MKHLLLDTNELKFFSLKLFDSEDFFELVVRLSFNLIVTIIIVRFLYYAISKRKDYLFTYITISVVVFLLCFLLESVKLQLGFALGLFAIFGIIRYRTAQIPIKEMTYLFIIIGISVINALANKKISYAELLITNVTIVLITWILERIWLVRHEARKTITYEKIDLIKPEKRKELIADLEERTGIKISRVEIGKIDFLRDTANVRIFYFEDQNKHINEDDDFLIQDDDS
ncbi:MAG: DUF4956 domain-containing protein [Marinilabiliales bacterium]